MAKIYSALIVYFISLSVQAASCCGGGQSAASVMIADHLQEWTFSTVYRNDLGQTNNNGQALIDADQNEDRTFTNFIEYKKLFSSRVQGNIGVNYIKKESKRLGKNESDSGLGDLALGSFYEALTNYNYSLFSPRVFVGAKFIIPFGENSFNSQKALRTDIRGTGFYKIDLPIVAVISEWKLSISPQYLPKQNSLSPSYAFTTSVSYNYGFNENFDLSGGLQWNYIAKKTQQLQSLMPGQYWELSFSPSWTINKSNSFNITYSDSTLIGKSRNSALYRSLSLGLTLSELL